MRVAVPVAEQRLCLHFGHCETFRVFEVEDGQVKGSEQLPPPPHAPGVIPEFLNKHNVDVILAGGMGQRALQFFDQFGIKVIIGAPSIEPEEAVKQYLDGSLETGANVCDH